LVEILDDGDAGSFSFSSATFEGREDAGVVLVTVTRLGGSRNITTVSYATSDGTAAADDDFEDTIGVVEFLDTETSKTISIPLTNDTIYEATDETFTVTLSAPTGGAMLGVTPTTTVTILDDGDAGTFEFTAAAFTGREDDGTIGVTVTRLGGSSSDVIVKYSTSDDTATGGADYTSVTLGELTFAEGVTEVVAFISITNDTTYEVDESFGVSLVEATGGSLIGSKLNSTSVTITDDGDAGTFEFSSSTFSGKEDSGAIAVTITRLGGMSGKVTIEYNTADDTATAPEDYAASGGCITFEDGETSQTVMVPVKNDTVFESPDETFTVLLSNATNGALLNDAGANASATVRDDGDAGTFAFTVSVHDRRRPWPRQDRRKSYRR